MKPKIPLEKEISSKNKKNSEPEKKIDKNIEEKDKIFEKPKESEKKSQEPKKNVNRKISEVISIPKVEEIDDLEHPSPLLSDEEEEDKEKIKNDFYKNKYKEKEKSKDVEIYNSNFLDNNKIIYVCVTDKKEKSAKNRSTSPKKYQSPSKKSVKMNLVNKINNNNSKFNNISNIQNIEKENNDINKEAINVNAISNSNCNISQKIIKENNNSEIKYSNKEINIEDNIQVNKTVNKQQNLKKSQKCINLKQNPNTKLKTIPVNKKSNSKTKAQKIVKKKLNLNTPIKKPVNKDSQEENNSNKIPPNQKQTLKKIIINKNENIHKNSLSNVIERECPIHKTINIGKTTIKKNSNKNKSQIFSNNHNQYQNEQNYEEIKKNSSPSQSIRKSYSFSKILINKKNDDNNDYQLNNNMNVISNGNNVPKANNIEMYQNNNLNNLIIPPINNNTIPKKLINHNHQNADIYNDFQQVKRKIQHYSLPKNHGNNSNMNNQRRISNIHNNSCFYDRTFEQKENMQDNSQYKKQTYDEGGKFNNVQTTYVVISKNNMDSKLKLMQKNIKTIDYENNRYLYPANSELKTKTCRFLPPGRNVSYLNDSQNLYQNQSYQNFPSYMENQNPKASTYKGAIKIHKSQNNIIINNNCEYYHNQNMNNNNNYYGNNYNNNVGSVLKGNKALTITAADRNNNNNYFNNKPMIKETNTFDNYDNYYNYERRFDTEPYFPSPINKKYY